MKPLLAAVALALPLGCNGNPAAPVIDGGYLSWTPPALWLAAAPGGSATGSVTVQNGGNRTVAIGSIGLGSSPPSFSSTSGSLSLDPGGSASVSVTYAPTSCPDGGQDLGQLVFQSDASNAPTFDLPLVGLCQPAAAPTLDAGVKDAGTDAGAPDAGPDAGMSDAGADAGSDAGA